MSKPWKHSLSSAKRFGGKPEDYIKIHDWFDQTKQCVPDVRHRAILHSAFGIFLCEQVFGHNITNSAGKVISVRDIGEQHVIEDMGIIPTMQDWLSRMPIEPWMSRPDKKVEEMKLEEIDETGKIREVTIPKNPFGPQQIPIWPNIYIQMFQLQFFQTKQI